MELILNNTQMIFQSNQMGEVAVDNLDRNASLPEYVTNVTKFYSRNSTLHPPNHNINQGSWINNGSIIPLYSIIFLLAVIGNSLVILTLVQNKRMRTITNIFLLNLALSDLCLGVFCLPFTLIGTLLRDFVFGEIFCKLLPYLQGNSYFGKMHDFQFSQLNICARNDIGYFGIQKIQMIFKLSDV